MSNVQMIPAPPGHELYLAGADGVHRLVGWDAESSEPVVVDQRGRLADVDEDAESVLIPAATTHAAPAGWLAYTPDGAVGELLAFTVGRDPGDDAWAQLMVVGDDGALTTLPAAEVRLVGPRALARTHPFHQLHQED